MTSTDGHGDAPTPALSEGRPANPVAGWEWLLGVIWLVFLGFPLIALLVADVAQVWRILGILAVLLFAVTFARGMYRLDHHEDGYDATRDGSKHLLVMAVLTALVTPILRSEMIGMLAYVVCLALLTLPLRWGLTVWGACVATAVATPLLDGEVVPLFLAGILILVGSVVLLIRNLTEREARHQVLVEEYRIGKERDRVARDVHDVLGHSLTVVTVKTELAERLIDIDPERAKAELAQVRSMARQSLAEIRATVSGLRVAQLAEELVRAREALDDAGIDAQLPDDPETVDPRHRIVLAWALREAVTNVVRHSEARQCRIAWGSDWLTVTDDGVGVRNTKEGNGLRGLRERVRQSDGSVELGIGDDGRGTEMRVQL